MISKSTSQTFSLMTQNKYIILDRDGVINHDSPEYIKCADEWDPIPRSLNAIGLLTKHDYKILLISNQSAISRHLMDFNDFLGIHKKLVEKCSEHSGRIYSTYYCFDHPDVDSLYRKPKPGMYLDIADRLKIELSNVFAIGDSPRDIKASLASGCKPLGVRTGNGEKISQELPDIQMFDDLYDAVEFIIDYDKQYILNI